MKFVSSANKWLTLGNLPSARYGHCMECDASNIQMLIYGGIFSITVLNDYSFLNLSSMQWSVPQDATGMTGRFDHACSIDNQNSVFYVFGGRSTSSTPADFLMFDIQNVTWTVLGTANSPCYSHQMVYSSANNLNYFFLGSKSNTFSSAVGSIAIINGSASLRIQSPDLDQVLRRETISGRGSILAQATFMFWLVWIQVVTD